MKYLAGWRGVVSSATSGCFDLVGPCYRLTLLWWPTIQPWVTSVWPIYEFPISNTGSRKCVEILLRNWCSCFTEHQQPLGVTWRPLQKELRLEILPLFATPTAVSNRSIRSNLWRQTYLVPSSQDPRATNARAELKGTGHTAKFQQAFYLQTLPNLTLP